jgi:Mg-chelatase subunit ChlD
MLPDCEKPFPESVSLDDTERGALVSAVMGRGVQGVDDFIKENESRGAVGEKIRKLRRELDSQLGAVREKKETDYARMEFQLEKRYSGRIGKVESRQSGLRGTAGGGDIIVSSDIMRLIAETSKPPKKIKKPGFWKRLKAAVSRFFRRVGAALVRFWDWLRGRKTSPSKKHEIAVPYMALPGGRTLDMDLAVDRVMADENWKARIDSRINRMDSPERLRVRLDDERYREAAKKILQEEIELALKKQKNEQKRRKRDVGKQLKDLEEEKRLLRQRMEEERKQLRAKKDEELKNIDRQLDRRPLESVRNELLDQFENAGYITRDEGRLYVTSRLVDRFAEIIYALEIEGLGSSRKRMISGIGGFGEFQRDNMRTAYEIGKLDILESVVSARLGHPGRRGLEDEDIIVNRELRGDQFHVVIMFDKSGSMDENNRLLAAKKAALALFKAVKLHNPKNLVDLVTFDSKVKVMDLVDVWNCSPEGFTNISEALNVSYGLLAHSRADRKLIYMITDGLPEAYTSPEGNVYIGDTQTSMQYAVSSATRLGRLKDLRLIMIMLEPRQKAYVDAAMQIAQAAEGSVIATDPQDLAKEMLVDYAASVV